MMEEYFDLLNEDGTKTGETKLRELVHRDGDLHGGSHIWIIRYPKEGEVELLLQKRSENKDAFPGSYDISSAGHLGLGETFEEAAVRELEEELGIRVKEEELTFVCQRFSQFQGEFHGKPFHNREINRVYLLERDVNPEELTLQKEEVDSVKWMNIRDIVAEMNAGNPKMCVSRTEIGLLTEWLKNNGTSPLTSGLE